ncbi:MAG TPA: ubiquitin carboxyl-terminal hydrolase family protein [Rhabdochlamydiaceae bacterium]|nr:ubiquitin carboxyl-terminal hydrolase family protein [Rhabdochlamydiaceae bacterium]
MVETLGKTNHYAGLCFAAAIVCMGLAFYDGLLGKRTFSLLLRGTFWALIATVIGTAGEILQKTTRVETPIVPATIYRSPIEFKTGQFPGMPNMGNTCFVNAPTQASMADSVYPGVYKKICERAKARHTSFKNFLELYPAQSGPLSSLTWPKMFSRKREAEPLLAIVNVRDVLVMLMMRRSGLKYDDKEFEDQYPTIHKWIGEFSKIRKDSDFPKIADNTQELRQEFTLMKQDPDIVRFFDQERKTITNEILGFDAYLRLIHAYENAVAHKLPVVSFGRWAHAPIVNICYLINGAGRGSHEDVEEFLRCLSKYVLPDDYPEVFFPLAYERKWEECPENEQDASKLQELKSKHLEPKNGNDLLTLIPPNKKIVNRATPENVLKINTLLREGANGQDLLNETFEAKRAAKGPNDPHKQTQYFINAAGNVRKYYLIKEKIVSVPKEKMPDRIILELIRYKWTEPENERKREKIDCAVKMPEKITICDQGYHLKSMILHSGPSEKGHDYTIVNKQGQYWYASDATVDRAEEAHVKAADREGYLYFYEKCISVESLEESL